MLQTNSSQCVRRVILLIKEVAIGRIDEQEASRRVNGNKVRLVTKLYVLRKNIFAQRLTAMETVSGLGSGIVITD